MKKFRLNKGISLVLAITFLINANAYALDITDIKNNRDNIAPSASFSVTAKKKLDVIVITDYKGEKLGKLQSSITDFKAKYLSKYDIRSVVADNLPKIDLGIQSGTFNIDVYGIVGKANYTAIGYYQPDVRYNFERLQEMKVCLNPVWIMPGQTPPTGTAIVPTSTIKNTKNYTYNNDKWTCDIYSFTNNSGMNYTYYPYYEQPVYTGPDLSYLKSNTPSINSGYLSTYYENRSLLTNEWFDTYYMQPTPSTLNFTFNPNISYFRSETYNTTNTVRALNLNSSELQARENSKAFYIIAMDGDSTDFYQSGIYNSDNSLNYMFGGLRNDNLGKYVKEADATVLALLNSDSGEINLGNVTENHRWYYGDDDESDLDDYYVNYYTNSYNMTFEESEKPYLQNMSLNQLLQAGSDSRIYDKNEIDGAGVVGRLDYFLTQGKDKIDLTIVTDKDTGYANSVSSLVKSSIGSSVDVSTTVIDNSSTRKVIGQRTYYNFNDNFNLQGNILRVGNDYNNVWYNLGDLKLEPVTAATVIGTNIKDMASFTSDKRPTSSTNTTASFLVTSGGDLYTTRNYFSDYLISSAERSGYSYKFNRSSINNEAVKRFGWIYYGKYSTDNSYCHIAMYVTTENNNLYLLYDNAVYLVCSDVYTTTSDWKSYGTYQIQALIGVKKNGEAFQIGYNTPLTKISEAKSSAIREYKDGFYITENNTYYDTILDYLNNIPSDIVYRSAQYTKTIKPDGTLSYYTDSSTDDEGYTTPAYTTYKTISQGRPVKVESYPEVNTYGQDFYCFIKLSNNTVLKSDKAYNAIAETNYTDFKSPTVLRNYGVFLKVDINGQVYINAFDDDYYYKGYKEIKLQDNIAEHVVDKRIVNIESINNDLIKAVPLREGSDRMLVYISDNYSLQVGAGAGTYFPWGGIDGDIRSYLENNKYAAYFITQKQAMSARFVPPYISSYYGGILNNLCYANLFDSYRFDTTDQLTAYLSNRYGINGLLEDPNGIYLIQGEDTLSYNIKYDDYETDPMNALKWRFTHTPTFFENDNGLNPFSGQWLTTFNESPTQVGKYIIECQAQDRPIENALFTDYWKWGDKSEPQNVYVHRRPVADFNIYFSKNGEGYNTNIADNSYDLDRLSTENRGIVKWKWKYRTVNSTEWTYGQIPTYLSKGLTYEVSLEVLDRQGAWSKPKSITIDTASVNLIPSIDANPTSTDWTNNDISIIVTADDNGENDFNRLTLTTSNGVIEPDWVDSTWYQKLVPITYTYDGIWYLHMRVFDNAGNTFYRNRGPYKIDKTPPGGTAVPYSRWWSNQDVNVTFSPWDNLSGVQRWRYVTSSNDGITWGVWTGYSWGPVPSTVSFNYEGLHKLTAEVTDNAGNIAYVTTGSFLIDKTAPDIYADKTGPADVFDSITINLSITDNLSGVRDTKYVFTSSTDKPASGWVTTNETSIAAKVNSEGTWYLHVESTDNAGNVSYKVYGGFKVTIVKLYDLTVTMMNDITWRDFYYNAALYNAAGKPTDFTRKSNTDIKAGQMPINFYNGSRLLDYTRDGIDAGCEVDFYLKSVGNPENVEVIVFYVTEEGDKTSVIQPLNCDGEKWTYKYTVPLECKIGSFVSFGVRAYKNGNIYGNDYWEEPWLPLNTDRKVFYISGNILDRLKFNQSH